MQQSLDAMKVALRILTALTEKHNPDEVDVEVLRSYAPLLASEPLDELACDVIRQALRNRAEVRSRVASGN